jgi:hypothetical protein
VNQQATIERAMFSVEAVPRLNNDDLRQVELKLREPPELAISRIIEKELQKKNESGCEKKTS